LWDPRSPEFAGRKHQSTAGKRIPIGQQLEYAFLIPFGLPQVFRFDSEPDLEMLSLREVLQGLVHLGCTGANARAQGVAPVRE